MKNPTRRSTLIALTLAALTAVTASATEGVSPGDTGRLAVVEVRCPTFSWGEDDGTVAYELVAYILPEDASQTAELTADTEVMFARVAGSATSWTPSAEQCFAPGGRYVWFVRAVTELVDDQVIEAGEWSAGRYFAVPAAPSAEEMRRALDVIRRWEEAAGDEAAAEASGSARTSGTGSETGAGTVKRGGGTKSISTASTAIRGDNPEVDVEAYGVVGTSASVWGAGVAAANTEGGPDLLLDGSHDGVPGAELSEWGLNRPGATNQTFTFQNSDSGEIQVDVIGKLTGKTVDAEELMINSTLVIDINGEWQGGGSMLPCVDCVTGSEIAANAVGTAQLDDGGVAEADIADGAVTAHKIADEAIYSAKIESGGVKGSNIDGGAVESGHLSNSAVTTAKIEDGAVTAAKIDVGAVITDRIRDDAVTAAKIAGGAVVTDGIRDDAVTMAKLAHESVGTNQIEHGGVETDDIGFNAVGTEQIADDAVTGQKLANGAVTPNHLEAGAVRTVQLYDGAVTAAKIATGAVGSAVLADGSVTQTKIAGSAIQSGHIQNGSITGVDIANDAIGGGQIANSSITGWEIAGGAINTGHIYDGGVHSIDIADGAVTGSKIANGTISGIDIENGSVGPADLATGLLRSKDDLYYVLVSEEISGAWVTVTASCRDDNDIAIGGSCSADPYHTSLIIEPPVYFFWETTLATAGVGCHFYNDSLYFTDGMALIYCLDVP